MGGEIVPNILVTGGAGYIGSNLVRDLLASGNNVVVLDKLVFGIEPISGLLSNRNFKLISGDVTNDGDLKKTFDLGIDSVIHLAAIVGDPACAADQDTAIQTNIDGTVKVANMSKSAGIKRFIFASTCSVYGAGGDKLLNEGSRLNPISLYAETRLAAEKDIAKITDDEFKPTILRFGTVYGLSPRMRFDLVVNYLTLKAIRDKEIRIFGGNQWRPFVHVKDIARALMLVLNSPIERVGKETFNVGDTAENYLLSRIGEIVGGIMPDVDVTNMDEIEDERSYRVSFGKIKDKLGFTARIKVEDGIMEMKSAIESKAIANPDDKRYYNYKQYE
jgi:nucleoside-diphosphate-sugar epimerase